MYRVYLLILLFLLSCDSGSFDKDKRQIMAKDAIRSQLPGHSRNFDVTSFKEDTLATWKDSNLEKPIQYTLHYKYTDSTGVLQQNNGTVLFTPDGHAIINVNSHINP